MGQVNALPLWTQKCSVSGPRSLTLEIPAGVWPSGEPGPWGGESGEGLVWGLRRSLSSVFQPDSSRCVWGQGGWMGVAQEEWGEPLCPLQGGPFIVGSVCRLGCPQAWYEGGGLPVGSVGRRNSSQSQGARISSWNLPRDWCQ